MESKKSSWSAFVDSELSELEELRLIRESDMAEMAPRVFRWNELRNKLIAPQVQPSLSVDEHVMLNERIMAALDAEGETINKGPTRSRPLWPVAAAASLVVAVAVGLIIQDPSSVGVDTGRVASSGAAPALEGQDVIAGPALVQNEVLPVVASGESQLKALDEETQERLRQYLEEHDRSVGRRANQPQFVTFPNGSN